MTSLFGGLALANAKLGAVHGFAGPLGGAFDAPHGALCARLLPEVMHGNLSVARRISATDVVERYRTIASLLTSLPAAEPEAGIEWVRELVDALRIPRLASYGVCATDFASVVEKAQAASSMKGNPVELERDELLQILERAL
jgi:alcohol dehydrogenase class IV